MSDVDWKMAVAQAYADQSTCVRRQVGAALFWGDMFVRGAKNTERVGLCETDCPRAQKSYAEQLAGVGYPPQCAEHAEALVLKNLLPIFDGLAVLRRLRLTGTMELVITAEPCPERCSKLIERAQQMASGFGEQLNVRWRDRL